VFFPQRGIKHEESLADDIFFWFPGIGWFYYLVNGYAPRTVNHFNPVSNSMIEPRLSFHHCLQFLPVFFDRHRIGVFSSLIAYAGMVNND
jgi:hypothetical protein